MTDETLQPLIRTQVDVAMEIARAAVQASLENARARAQVTLKNARAAGAARKEHAHAVLTAEERKSIRLSMTGLALTGGAVVSLIFWFTGGREMIPDYLVRH